MVVMFDYKIIVCECYFHTTQERGVLQARF